MSRNTLVGLLIAAALVAGLAYFAQANRNSPSPASSPAPASGGGLGIPVLTPNPQASPEESVREVTVQAQSFSFNPTAIRVREGDRVRLTLVNNEGFHDWVVDEFNVSTPQIQAGQTAMVEFVADRAGTFEYYCSVADHRQRGMVGQLIVE